jgi:DNA-binding NarL/FixJ family response regulator
MKTLELSGVAPSTAAPQPYSPTHEREPLSTGTVARVFICSEDQNQPEAVARLLANRGDMTLLGPKPFAAINAETLIRERVDVLLLLSAGNLPADLIVIQRVYDSAPGVRILLLGSTREDPEFLQCVRAGIAGYLPRDASADQIVNAIHALQAGHAVCPASLCTALFRHLQRQEPVLPCGSPSQRLGLTRREQQIVPLIAKGLSNKEIANHFCLSEQTVKNHLYRMKHKIGAEDRFNIVHRFRVQGFLL